MDWKKWLKHKCPVATVIIFFHNQIVSSSKFDGEIHHKNLFGIMPVTPKPNRRNMTLLRMFQHQQNNATYAMAGGRPIHTAWLHVLGFSFAGLFIGWHMSIAYTHTGRCIGETKCSVQLFLLLFFCFFCRCICLRCYSQRNIADEMNVRQTWCEGNECWHEYVGSFSWIRLRDWVSNIHIV